MESATDVFAQKKFSKDTPHSEICYRYDSLVIRTRVAEFME